MRRSKVERIKDADSTATPEQLELARQTKPAPRTSSGIPSGPVEDPLADQEKETKRASRKT